MSKENDIKRMQELLKGLTQDDLMELIAHAETLRILHVPSAPADHPQEA